MDKKQYQVTLFCESGKYRPVSCLIKKDAASAFDAQLKETLKREGLLKICQTRGWDSRDLKEYGYTKIKIREYDKEKIEAENAARYEKIKQERGWK